MKVSSAAKFWIVALLGLASCGGEPEETGERGPRSILEGEWAEGWKAAEIPGGGKVAVEEGVLRLEAGKPMTGAVFSGGGDFELPADDYVVEFEARRVEGTDFFAAMTFPAGALDRCVTLVLGGWGGSLVGISCIDHLDASENGTRAMIPFENGKWYRVRVEVGDGSIRAFINGSIVVRAATTGRVLSMRAGDIEACAPFGFATYWSVGEVRGLTLKKGTG